MRPLLYSQMAWRVALDVFSRASLFLLNILVARWLGVEDFGRFGYALSLALIFYIFTDLGIHLRLIKELGMAAGKLEETWKAYLNLKIVLILACFALFLLSFPFLWKWEDSWLLILAFIWMSSNSLVDFLQFVCNGLKRMDIARLQLLAQRSLLFLGLGSGIFISPTLRGALAGLAAGSFAGTLIGLVYLFRALGARFHFKWDFVTWRGILSASIPLGIAGAFGAWYLRMGPVFLAWIWDDRVVGEYTAAFRFFEITYIIPAAIMSISVSHLSGSLRKNASLFQSDLRRVSLVMGALALLSTAFLYLAGPAIFRLLFGPAYRGSSILLHSFAWIAGLVFLNYLVTHLMVVLDHQKRHAFHEAMAFLVSLAASVFLIPAYGAKGAALALLTTELTLFIATLSFLMKKQKALLLPSRVFLTSPL